MKMRGARLAAGLACGLALANPVSAQYAVGGGVDYLGYAFDPGLGAEAAQLFMVPVGVRLPVTPEFSIDIFSAWAEGRVERNDEVLKLSGPVDTSVKAAYAVTPWALLSVGVNLPTGEASHTNEEAIVASVLSTDLLGFRETTWGTGMAVTSSVATAINRGGFGLGIAAAYAMRGKFEPSATDGLEYQPGSETRVRVGLDRNIGNSTFMAGATFINYAQDQADGINLFQAGNRLRFDASYAFRAGAGVWTIYGADLIRGNGDLRLDIVDDVGALVGDTTVTTAKQNLIVGGVMGTVGLGGGFVFRPHLDFKYQSREEAPLAGETEGNTAGSGWMIAAGGDIPLRIFGGYEFFPKARVYIGSIEDALGASVGTLGMEFKGNMRWSF
jgi:hypothetical protein